MKGVPVRKSPASSAASPVSGRFDLASLVAAAALLAVAVRPKRSASSAATARLGVKGLDVQGVAQGVAPLQPDPTLVPPAGRWKRVLWRVDRFQRSHRPVAFGVAVTRKFSQDRAGHLAALVAYYGFFSLFPLMLAFTSVLGFVVPDPDDQARFADEAADQIPVVGRTIRDTAGQLDGSAVAVVVGVLLAVWSGLKIVDAMQNALNTVWAVPPVERPNIAERRLRGIAMLGLIGGGLVCSVVASSIATALDVIPGAGRVAIWAASAMVSIGLYLVAFRILTDARLAWSDLLPGAVFGGVCWWALQTFGSVFIANQQQSSGEAYGQYASIIALFAFLFLASQLSILGAEINVVRARRLWPRSLTPGSLTDADIEAFEHLANSTRQDASYRVELLRVPDADAD